MADADVATPCASYRQQQVHWAPCAALMGGTVGMRRAERLYLPQFAKETNARYAERLAASVLYEAFPHTVRSLSGRPFAKPVQLAEGTEGYFQDYADDVDGSGTNMTVFARRCMLDLLVYGRTHILVEYPSTYQVEQQLGRPLTLADARAMRLRSYWVRLSPEEIIGWAGQRVGGVEELTQLRVRYSSVESDPGQMFGERSRQTVAVWEPSHIVMWSYDEQAKQWVPGDAIPNTLGHIPLVTVYAQRGGLLESVPPLEGLAWLNVKHWQNQSDQDQIERMARVPMLFLAGFSPEEVGSVEIGPFKSFAHRSSEAKVQVIEPRGDAVRIGADALAELVQQMEDMAMEALRRKPGNPTATELSLQAGRNVCDLEAYAMLLERGLQKALEWAAAWDGVAAEAPAVKVNQDYGYTLGDVKELEELRADLQLGVIDRRTYLWERQRRGLYSADMDIDDTLEQADADPGNAMFGASQQEPSLDAQQAPQSDRDADDGMVASGGR